jgi:hypothetical protein
VTNQHVSVRSDGCGAACAGSDTYRLSAYETTGFIPRFNNSASQITVLVLQSASAQPITGKVVLRGASGAVVASPAFTMPARGSYVLNTASVAPGVSGSISIAHDGRLGDVSGKAVSVEPATGFTFDTELTYRPR